MLLSLAALKIAKDTFRVNDKKLKNYSYIFNWRCAFRESLNM